MEEPPIVEAVTKVGATIVFARACRRGCGKIGGDLLDVAVRIGKTGMETCGNNGQDTTSEH